MQRLRFSRLALVTAGVFAFFGVVAAVIGSSELCPFANCAGATVGWALPLASGTVLAVLALLLIDSANPEAGGPAVPKESACPACGRPMGEEWRICPHCGSVRTCEIPLLGGRS